MQAGAMRSQLAKSVLTLIGRTTVPSEAFFRDLSTGATLRNLVALIREKFVFLSA